jgi:hypothetical protein
MLKVRQGDVYIVEIDRIPAGASEIPREGGRVVLAHGGVTGHAHAISDLHVQHYRDDGTVKALKSENRVKLRAGGALPFTYLRVIDRPATLEHEEHGPITLPPGTYEVRRQREYTPGAIRNVAD